MSSLVLDPLQRITRFEFQRGTTAVAVFAADSVRLFGGDEWYELIDDYEDYGTGPYFAVVDGELTRIMSWWYDDVRKWSSVYGKLGLKGVAFEVPLYDESNVERFTGILPPGGPPEGVSIVDVDRQYPSIDTLTNPALRPAVSNYYAPGVDPRFYIFVDNSGRMNTDVIGKSLQKYRAQLREWRIPYRVIPIFGTALNELTGLGGERWLQWMYAPFVRGFYLGRDVALYDWAP